MATDILIAKRGQKSSDELTFRGRLRTPALVSLAEAGEARFFIQFGGQAGSYIDELRTLFTHFPLVRPLIEKTAALLQEELKYPDAIGSGLFPRGLSLLDWIQNKEATPPASYLASSTISQSLIFLTQVAHYQVICEYGCDTKKLLRFTDGITGHSQGIMTAILVAMGLEGEEFEEKFLQMVRYFFWQGIRMQQSFPERTLPLELIKEAEDSGWGKPTPMASLAGLTPEEVEPFLRETNGKLEEDETISIALVNGWRRLVLAGSPKGLFLLRRLLRAKEEAGKKDPAHRFKIQWEFLSVSGPYHSPHMREGLDSFRKDLTRLKFSVKAQELKKPVFATDDGRDLKKSRNLLEDLLQMQFLKGVDWNACTQKATRAKQVTHILDFGPGEIASTLTFLNREGEGVTIIPCATDKGRNLFLQTSPHPPSLAKEGARGRSDPEVWADLAPRLVQLPNKKLAVDNRYTRFTSRPPVFGGGMTPTSVETEIVSQALNNGFLVEWAGGGQVTEAILRKRLDELVTALQPGQGIIFNALYLDPYLWNLHYPLLPRLKREGYPIEGLTISAGVPTREKAAEILATMTAAGIWQNSFKPGSDDQIASVLEIAKDHPQLTLIMQIEGGRAGGHHSWEDLYGLLERNYAAIRRQKNIILCVGGGIGLPEEATPLLMGHWHASGKIMPVDAVFLGTRLMACREAKSSPEVKKLLVSIPGTDRWVGRGRFESGVTSGQSQLGADVHYADNTMSRVANLVDQLSTQGEAAILARKQEIITALNKTCKPYFGELPAMTYAAVLERMIELMAPGKMPDYFIHDGVWFDTTFRMRAFEFSKRIVARLVGALLVTEGNPCGTAPSDGAHQGVPLHDPSTLDHPKDFLKKILQQIPSATTTILHPEDVDYFLFLCRQPGKPVNFVPVIDKDLKRWFKSDSLWQAHDPRYKADQVLTIPGTQGVKGITKVDEPVAEIFESFVADLTRHLKRETNGRQIPMVEKDPLQTSRWILEGGIKKKNYLPTLIALGAEVRTNGSSSVVTLTHAAPDGRKLKLPLRYTYHPDDRQVPLQVTGEMKQSFKAFYQKLWLGDSKKIGTSHHEKISVREIQQYLLATGEKGLSSKEKISPGPWVIRYFWRPLAQVLFDEKLDLDLLSLLHLSNEFQFFPCVIVKEGEELRASVRLTSVVDEGTVRRIFVEGELERKGDLLVRLKSRFLVRLPMSKTHPSRKAALPKTEEKVVEIPQERGFEFEETIAAPLSNEPYALTSRDLNPIHTDRQIAAIAGLLRLSADGKEEPTTIVHGMQTAAATLAALGRQLPFPVARWQTDFIDKVFPGSTLKVKGRHVANRDGRQIFEVVTEDVASSRVVLKGRAELEQRKTVYLFTGQGSQVAGMGMTAYHESAAARQVWDQAESFCREKLGFSLLTVVRDNPKELLVAGEKVSHPKGVLHLTQFTQVGLTVLAIAQIAELKAAGLYYPNASFAGHSLGEYAALSATGIIPLEQVIQTVYHRGLTMQHFVPRDASGRSPYGMVVVRPSLVGWTEKQLEEKVAELSQSGKKEIYLVNYNIENSQYAITGRLELLALLEKELKDLEQKRGVTKPSLIPIEGVDVPFHSQILRPGVEAFRKTLEETIPHDLHPDLLIDRYIPNLNAEPFRLDRDYVVSVFKLTESPVLKKVLGDWGRASNNRSVLSRVLLVELLAYQFASPVQWIRTQKVLLVDNDSAVDRVIEIGPSPVLANMMKATLRSESRLVPPEIFHFDSERDKVFYRVKLVENLAAPVNVPSAAPLPISTPTNISAPAPADRPLTVEKGLRRLLALKLNLRPEEISESETLEALSGGNSARRNELLSDIGSEFGLGALEEAHQLPFSKLVVMIGEKANYSAPGPFLQKSIDRAIKEKLPLSRTAIIDHLSGERQLPTGLVGSVISLLPLAVRSGNSHRAGLLSPFGLADRMTDGTATIDWLNKIVDQFAADEGIVIPYRSQQGTTAVAASEASRIDIGPDSPLARWARELSELCGLATPPPIVNDYHDELAELRLYKKAFGEAVEKVIRPQFDPAKKVTFTSFWNWGRRDLVEKFYGGVGEPVPTLSDEEEFLFLNRATPEMVETARYLGNPRLANRMKENLDKPPLYRPFGASFSPEVSVNEKGEILYREKERPRLLTPDRWTEELLKKGWVSGTPLYADQLNRLVTNGISFQGKTAIVTGASPGSIAWEIVRALLIGGGRVIATTSSYSDERLRAFRELYHSVAGRGAELHLFPFSQGSHEDIQKLVSWTFSQKWVPDYLFPFAALGESATLTLMNPDSSTATLRVLLQGVEWLIATLAREFKKAS
ncbi:MAG: DUF1729 domain-containing protein, partial [Deltaproteobacteria bacterium]|nr:DUF1729 domain-containing protein [Deltaproteobacteria bacterium]